MAVRDWPTTFGYNMLAYPLRSWLFGPWDVRIEHAHRLLASTVGLIAIATVVVMMVAEPRRWVRVMAWMALAFVIFQGILGGMRVIANERLLALVHGCVGPAFFVFAGALAVVTSRRWRTENAIRAPAGARSFQLLAFQTAILAYAQLVLGAFVRHIPPPMGPGGFRVAVFLHLTCALLLVLHVGALVYKRRRLGLHQSLIATPMKLLTIGVIAQIVLGMATWVLRYGWPQWLGEHAWNSGHTIVQESTGQAIAATAHVALGSVVVLNCWIIALRAFRFVRPAAAAFEHSKAPARGLVEAAP